MVASFSRRLGSLDRADGEGTVPRPILSSSARAPSDTEPASLAPLLNHVPTSRSAVVAVTVQNALPRSQFVIPNSNLRTSFACTCFRRILLTIYALLWRAGAPVGFWYTVHDTWYMHSAAEPRGFFWEWRLAVLLMARERDEFGGVGVRGHRKHAGNYKSTQRTDFE